MYGMNRSVYSPRIGRATESRKYAQIDSKKLPSPRGVRSSTVLPVWRTRTNRGITRISNKTAMTCMITWLETSVISPPGVNTMGPSALSDSATWTV